MKNESAINAFQMAMFEKLVADIGESDLRTPAAGHGHTPLWLLGHLAQLSSIRRSLGKPPLL